MENRREYGGRIKAHATQPRNARKRRLVHLHMYIVHVNLTQYVVDMLLEFCMAHELTSIYRISAHTV